MKVITCFSYKGGAGRTVAAANIAAALASKRANVGAIDDPLKCRVALIDLDVFSAGTHRVFDIQNEDINVDNFPVCVQDYLRTDMRTIDYMEKGAIRPRDTQMKFFCTNRGGSNNIDKDFALFPARAEPDEGFVVQMLHHNLLIELLDALEAAKYDYVILDGESGDRSMARIALKLAHVVLMFFRLTWQHVDGTLEQARAFKGQQRFSNHFYLIPTCVPLTEREDGIYCFEPSEAPGLESLKQQTHRVLRHSDLNNFAQENKTGPGPGHFWARSDDEGGPMCIHESLFLKGEESILVFQPQAREDPAAEDYYRIAAEIKNLHPAD